MYVLAQLEFGNSLKDNITSIVYNLNTEFYNFYASEDLKEKLQAEQADIAILESIEKNGITSFIVSRENIPFKFTINYREETVLIEPVKGYEKQDMRFYTYRALEACNNFAIYELDASE